MHSPASPSLKNIVAIAALAFIAACASHEIVGHGVACLAGGGRITLLTSVYFHCENVGVGVDLAGPFVNLLLGSGAYVLLERDDWSPNLHQFLVLTLAFNLYWLAGCMFTSATMNKSDFAEFLRVLAINPPWLGRVTLGALGLLVYLLGMRATTKHVADGTSLVVSYAVAGIVSCGAALFFVGAIAPALREAALESFGASVGLFLIGTRSRPLQRQPTIASADDYGWLIASALATIAFFLLLGRGMVVVGNV